MIHKFKALGLGVLAVLALSAVIGSAAQANITANSYPTTVTSTSALGNNVFTFEGNAVECAIHSEATIKEASTTTTTFLAFTSCKAFGFASATVDPTGCHEELHYDTNGDLVRHHIKCEDANVIHIAAGNCSVTIDEQGPLSSSSVANSGNHLSMQANISGIAYTITKDGFLCPLSGTGAKTGGTFKQGSAVTVKPVSGGTDLTAD